MNLVVGQDKVMRTKLVLVEKKNPNPTISMVQKKKDEYLISFLNHFGLISSQELNKWLHNVSLYTVFHHLGLQGIDILMAI